MAQQIINYNEEMVGANHPTKPDTLSRAFLISHDNTGGMKGLTSDPATPENYQYYWETDAKRIRVYDGAAWQTVGSKFITGTYTGDAAATKAITGLGFQPKAVWIHRKVSGYHLVYKNDQDALLAWNSNGAVYLDDQIISLDADGFTVGDATGAAGRENLNAAANYCYLAQG